MEKIQYCERIEKFFIVILFERKFVCFSSFGCLLLFDLNFLLSAAMQNELAAFDLENKERDVLDIE
jgi:hypothetical protein